MTICSPQGWLDLNFLDNRVSDKDEIDKLFDNFERLGLIYISRNRVPIIIRNNSFSQNIGTFGGAITINSPNWNIGNTQDNMPNVFIIDNHFNNNSAYFSGSAIYLRSTLNMNEIGIKECGGIYLLNNTFSNNTE